MRFLEGFLFQKGSPPSLSGLRSLGGSGGVLGGGPRRKKPCGRGSGGVRDPCFSRGGVKWSKNATRGV